MVWKAQPPEHGNEAHALADSIAAVAKKIGAASPKTTTLVFDSWDDAVGPEIAKHTAPISLVDGLLVIGVDDQRWAAQLKWMTAQIAEKINTEAGSTVVERVEVKLEKNDTAGRKTENAPNS